MKRKIFINGVSLAEYLRGGCVDPQPHAVAGCSGMLCPRLAPSGRAGRIRPVLPTEVSQCGDPPPEELSSGWELPKHLGFKRFPDTPRRSES